MVFFKFLNFFAIFLEFSIPGLVGTHQNDFFFLLSRPFPTYICLKSCQSGGFLFFELFCYFLEFSITSWEGIHWNDFFVFCFLFSLFLGLPQLVLAWKDATMVFFNFFEFFAIFFEFSITGQVGTHWNDFFFLSYSAFPNLFSLFLGLLQHILPRKEAIIVFSIFLEFSITGRVGTPRNDFFFFSRFLGHSQLILA